MRGRRANDDAGHPAAADDGWTSAETLSVSLGEDSPEQGTGSSDLAMLLRFNVWEKLPSY